MVSVKDIENRSESTLMKRGSIVSTEYTEPYFFPSRFAGRKFCEIFHFCSIRIVLMISFCYLLQNPIRHKEV